MRIQGISLPGSGTVGAGALWVCLTAIVAKEVFKKISCISQHQIGNLISTFAAVSVSAIIFNTAVSLGSVAVTSAAVTTGVLAFFLFSQVASGLYTAYAAARFRSPRVFRGGETVSLKTRVMHSLTHRNVFEFIRDAVRKEKPQWIRQLCQHLFGLPQFQDESARSGLAVYLQEMIANQLVRFNKPQLVDELFLSRQALQNEIALGAPSLINDLVRMCADNIANIVDGEGRFKAYAIIDGSIFKQLKDHPDRRIQRLAIEELQVSSSAAANDYLSIAISNTPSLRDIDFQTLLAQLQFEAADLQDEAIPQDERRS